MSSEPTRRWHGWTLLALAASAVAQAGAEALLARVDGTAISVAQFEQGLRESARERFYHGQVPPAQRSAFEREVAQGLIDRELLLREAERRQIAPDPGWVAERLAAAERRYGQQPDWGPAVVAELEGRLRAQSRLNRLGEQVQAVAPPDAAMVAAYYRAHPAQFTEPERLRVALILLAVEPWADAQRWEAARQEGAALVRQLRQGADFAELARLHSQDASAEAGGDLGYLHRGMLGSTAEQALAPLAPGEVSEPVRLLEGIAIFALRERRTPRLSPLAEVRARAAELCRRERSDQARRALLARLRAGAHIEVPDPGYRVLLAGGVEPAPDAAHGR